MSLAKYVKRRNGVALGKRRSMRNMLARSLGAGSFPMFWRYWNPIWGYYLSRNIMKPASSFLPIQLAVLLTFTVSGLLHDLAASLIHWQVVFFITPWFALMGLVAVIFDAFSISYRQFTWLTRASINTMIISCSLWFTYWLSGSVT